MFFNKQEKLEVVIGRESLVRGEISSKGTVRIDGVLEGGISADCVVIGEKGSITGDAVVRVMVIGGKISGNIRAEEGVEIQNSGDVCGDIFAPRLTIADGGKFDGRSTMQRTKEISYNSSEATSEV
jgi:cytoskeletal protein CcmA (bactofilin family)